MLVLGHRGAILEDGRFYQNSQRAFDEALATADGFETDACVDQDGAIFLIHEARYTDPAKGVEYGAVEHLDAPSAARMGTRRIDELSTPEMHALRLKDGTPLPTLQQAIELTGTHPGKLLNIELKAWNVASPVIRSLTEAFRKNLIRPDCVLVSSFNHAALPHIRKELPDVQIGAIVMDDVLPAAPLFPWQPGSRGLYTPFSQTFLGDPLIKQIEPDVFVMPESLLATTSINMISSAFPKATLAGWVFTERGAFNFPHLKSRLDELKPTGKIRAIMVDNPRKYAPLLRTA